MARERDDISRKPDRVIVLDADDPMTRIHGRFVWQEEHDRVVAEVRQRAFAEGNAAAAQESATPMGLSGRRTRSLHGLVRAVVAVLLILLVVLMLPIVLF